ncbi:U3 small nucleolar RNA-associated protein MPP10 [Colletotrichum liriopes]|uniref:U3 small nucleolar ribonucleoprotein protein MPP10 n=1 Tax=Colletotrichum liriopes TaxID=708192 RepID=A0AA37GF67_9PEZI|nr:U3 small nucleolar RNA-associated protein MPP10 [Colletotrichum liriopes]
MAAGSSTSSSLTSTTNTLTFAPGMAAQLPSGGVADVRALYDNLGAEKRHAFLQPPSAIPSASLQVVKDTLDAFAGQISDEQLRLLKEATKKRKRADGGARADVLKIRKVHVDGFETSQVWQQARRIIQSALNHSKETLKELEERNEVVTNGVNGEETSVDSNGEDSELEEGSSDEEEVSGSDLESAEEDDDEDIDWTADPLAPSSKSGSSKRKDDDMEEDAGSDDEEEEEDGPTFGDMDLNAPEGASDDEDMDDAMEDDEEFNANGIYFKDFFAPPAKKASKDGKYKKNRSVHFAPKAVAEEDVERAMEDVRRDLFDDESDHGDDSDDALSDVSAGDPRSRRSAHERRQAKLAEEIRKLEAESVAKRQWTLTGEASAVERPMNSLLEEDLSFEHLGKPVPVITAEVSEGIEDLIKRRILAQDFDEVLRRRPDADLPQNTRRGLIELDDSKSGKGLAEIYEEEHIKNADPDNYVSKSDEKLQKEEQEVEKMWKDLSAKLDSLSSWHYKPKPAAPSLTVVSDAATIAMEDAQPTTAQGVSGGQSMIAPQEVYKAGKDTAEKGEVVAKSGLPIAKQEMSREDKLRRRRREKERIRKAGGTDKKPLSKKAQMQKDTMADLKKGGVKVINRKGEVVDVDGNKAKAEVKATSSSFKL